MLLAYTYTCTHTCTVHCTCPHAHNCTHNCSHTRSTRLISHFSLPPSLCNTLLLSPSPSLLLTLVTFEYTTSPASCSTREAHSLWPCWRDRKRGVRPSLSLAVMASGPAVNRTFAHLATDQRVCAHVMSGLYVCVCFCDVST